MQDNKKTHEGHNYKFKIDKTLIEITTEYLTGREILIAANYAPSEYYLKQIIKGNQPISIGLEQTVCLSEPGLERFVTIPKEANDGSDKPKTYKFKVDKMMLETDSETMTGSEIMLAAGYSTNDYFLKQIIKGQPVNIEHGQTVNMSGPGLERFVTIPKEANDGGDKPQKYKFKVDKKMLETESEYLTGSEILNAAGYSVKDYYLKQIIKGQPINIEQDQKVCIGDPGLERFVTIPKEATDGSFDLFEEDIENLKKWGGQWETLTSNGNWLILKNFPIPDGYNVREADVAINIPTNYPQGKLDMAYFSPAIRRIDGTPIPQTQVTTNIGGRTFQRWSRHRNRIAWRVGVDSIVTHIEEIKNWLNNEFVKRPRKDEAA